MRRPFHQTVDIALNLLLSRPYLATICATTSSLFFNADRPCSENLPPLGADFLEYNLPYLGSIFWLCGRRICCCISHESPPNNLLII